MVALYHVDGSTLIDAITFGAQTTDISYERVPDGSATLSTMNSPTPGTSNLADPALVPEITGSHDGSGFTVSFESSASYFYTLWRSEDLSDGSWTMVVGQSALPGNGGADTLTDVSLPGEKAFYRVTAELP